MIQPQQLRDLIIVPVCKQITPGGDVTNAVELMLGTAMQESGLVYLAQLGGPALGLWQMEPATHDDLRRNSDVVAWVKDQQIGAYDARAMTWNLRYACFMARMLYRRVAAPLPSAGDIAGQALYYKRYYNTPAGAATVDQYVANWNRLKTLL